MSSVGCDPRTSKLDRISSPLTVAARCHGVASIGLNAGEYIEDGLLEDFIARYRKEYDFYDQAARLVAQTLEVNLQAAGIRSMVTSRAKSVLRLEAKVRQRAFEKKYATVDDI